MAEKTLQERLRDAIANMDIPVENDMLLECVTELDRLTAQLKEARELLLCYAPTFRPFWSPKDGCLSQMQRKYDQLQAFLAASEPSDE